MAEGGQLESRAPADDIALFLNIGPSGAGHSMSLTWRDAGDYHQANMYCSEEYRRSAGRPKVIWTKDVRKDLQVQVILEHPDVDRGDDPGMHGGAFHVYYKRSGGDLIPVESKKL